MNMRCDLCEHEVDGLNNLHEVPYPPNDVIIMICEECYKTAVQHQEEKD